MATEKKAKNLSAGPSKITKKAGPVDPKGQYTKVQERTLGNMKKGGKMKKAQTGITTKKGRDTINVTDTSGYAAGKKAGYPAQMITPKTKYTKSDTTNVTVNRNMIKSAIKKKKP